MFLWHTVSLRQRNGVKIKNICFGFVHFFFLFCDKRKKKQNQRKKKTTQ